MIVIIRRIRFGSYTFRPSTGYRLREIGDLAILIQVIGSLGLSNLPYEDFAVVRDW
jgi:hypothetical protein